MSSPWLTTDRELAPDGLLGGFDELVHQARHPAFPGRSQAVEFERVGAVDGDGRAAGEADNLDRDLVGLGVLQDGNGILLRGGQEIACLVLPEEIAMHRHRAFMGELDADPGGQRHVGCGTGQAAV